MKKVPTIVGLLAVLMVVAVVAGVIVTQQLTKPAEAQNGLTLMIGSAVSNVGEQTSVDLEILNMPEPGLGAWTIDIDYDPDIVSVVDCDPDAVGVCNPEFGNNTIRITGASAQGLLGDVTLGTIFFQCDAEGVSPLALFIEVLADATVGNPQDISDDTSIENGSITCGPATRTPTATPPPTPPFANFHAHYACRQMTTGLLQDTGVDVSQAEPRCPGGWRLMQILVNH